MITKQEARAQVINARKQLSKEECHKLSERIFEKVVELKEFKAPKCLLLYSEIRNEVSTRLFLDYALHNNIIVAYPRVEGDIMKFYRINSYEDLKQGYMGILEPLKGLVELEPLDGVIIVPGVAFDKKRARCGYGKGFYDKYLWDHKALTKIGICFDFQLFDSINTETHDILMDFIVTESTIF